MKLDNENKTSSESTYPPAWIKQQHYLWVSYSVYLFIWISAFVIGICFSEAAELAVVYDLLADALREAVRAGHLSPLVIVELGLNEVDK